jgi:hypothetical protein
LGAKEAHALSDIADAIAEAAFQALEKPYAEVVSLAARQTVSVKRQQRIRVFMANATEASSFEELFADAQAGHSLAHAAKLSGIAARELLGAAQAVLPRHGSSQPGKQDHAGLVGGELGYFGFEDISGFRGVLVAKVEDDDASFIGIAKGPQTVSTKENGEGAARRVVRPPENAANRVSASLITELASRF